MAIIACASCGTRNRVRAVARGTPRCPRCKTALPWVVDADEEIPLLVVLSGGREVDRIAGALPGPALEARLAPLLAA